MQILVFDEQLHADLLSDESRQTGQASRVCFPRDEQEVCEAVLFARRSGLSITPQGARTGITAGAVPEGGLIIDFSRMNRIKGLRHDVVKDQFSLLVEPGLTLQHLRDILEEGAVFDQPLDDASEAARERWLEAGPLMFTPDPTETSASLGGMVACNASGALSFRYGSIRPHVLGLRVVLASGDVLSLRRGACHAREGCFELRTESGGTLAGILPSLNGLRLAKHAAGYPVAPDMDMLDLFVGAEGTLGLVTEIELRLLPTPPERFGVMAFPPDEAAALRLVRMAREADIRPAAIEYFDPRALDLLRLKQRGIDDGMRGPALRDDDATALYIEYHLASADRTDDLTERLCVWLDETGGGAERAWMAGNAAELERMKAFRHAVPEAINERIAERKKQHPALTKLGTDMAVPDEKLEEVMSMYHEDLAGAGLEYALFGHIGNNHLHVNILPRNPDEYAAGTRLYERWARRVSDWGGTVSAEHGIGKLKKRYLRILFGEAGIRSMREVKHLFDPDALFNPGNLF